MLIRKPSLNDALCASLFTFKNPFVVSTKLHAELFVGLYRVVQLERKKVFGLREFLHE